MHSDPDIVNTGLPTRKSTASYEGLVYESGIYIKNLIHTFAPGANIYLFGSRARGDAGKSSDFDIWIDGNIDPHTLIKMQEVLEESFVPFPVNFVTTRELKGEFGKQVRKDAIQWNRD